MARGILGKALRGAAPVAAQWAEMSYKEDMATKRQERLLELSQQSQIGTEGRAETRQIAKEGRAEEASIRKEGRKTTSMEDQAKYLVEIGAAEDQTSAVKMLTKDKSTDVALQLSKEAIKGQLAQKGDPDYESPAAMYRRIQSELAGGAETPATVTEPPPPEEEAGMMEQAGSFISDVTSRAEDRPRRTRGGTTAPKAEPPSPLEKALSVIDRTSSGRSKARPPSVSEMDVYIDSILADNPDMEESAIYSRILDADTNRARSVYKRVRQRMRQSLTAAR